MCPNCGEQLVAFELEGIEIDRCVQCGGTWLDTGEIERIAEFNGLDPRDFTRALQEAQRKERGRRKCPRCPARLDLLVIPRSTPIELDRCPHGHGVWLDKGEMETLIQDRAATREGVVARFFAELYKHEREQALTGAPDSSQKDGTERP